MLRFVGIILILIFTQSCDDEAPIKKLHSYPQSNLISTFRNKENFAELYISLTADLLDQIHGQTQLRTKHSPSMMPSTIKVGGLPILSSYLATLREKLEKQSNTEYLSLAMGSTLPQPGVKSREKKIISKILPHLKLDLVQLGPREFESLNSSTHEGIEQENHQEQPQWINSNILSLATGKPLAQSDALPYIIKSVGKTFIGIMAVTSYNSLDQKQKNEANGIYFQDPLTAILRTRNLLKSKNVHLNFLLYQGRIDCPKSILDSPLALDQLTNTPCLQNKRLELNQLLTKLPPGTIDLIISPSAHLTAGLIKDTPILGLPNPNTFLALAKLAIDDNQHKINLKSSYFLPPLKLCHYIFAGLEDCVLSASTQEMNKKRFDYLENTAFGLIPSKFLGNKISKDSLIESIITDK